MLIKCFPLEVEDKTTKFNESPGWIDVAWFMLSAFLGPFSWWFSPKVVHLWITTQEQRDFKSLPVLIASSAAFSHMGSILIN